MRRALSYLIPGKVSITVVDQDRNINECYRHHLRRQGFAVGPTYKDDREQFYISFRDRALVRKMFRDANDGDILVVSHPLAIRSFRRKDNLELVRYLERRRIDVWFAEDMCGLFSRGFYYCSKFVLGTRAYAITTMRRSWEGRYSPIKVPFGYRRDKDGTLRAHQHECRILTSIAYWSDEWNCSAREIDEHLDRIKAVRRQGEFHPQTLRVRATMLKKYHEQWRTGLLEDEDMPPWMLEMVYAAENADPLPVPPSVERKLSHDLYPEEKMKLEMEQRRLLVYNSRR
jgi:hypothetical protein